MVDKFSRALVVLFFGCIIIGIINVSFKPDPEVIHTPAPKAKVIYKDRVKTVEVPVAAPLPDSCTEVLSELSDILAANRDITDDAEAVEQFARETPLANFLDPTKAAPSQEKIGKISERVQANLVAALDANDEVNISWEACQADVVKTSN